MNLCSDRKAYSVLIITPTTLRPDLLWQTLRSFWNSCFSLKSQSGDIINYRHAIHLDKIGNINYSVSDVLNAVQNYIDRDYIWAFHINYEGCSLAKAFYYLWSFASTCAVDYVFYLEDDWILLDEIDLSILCRIMDNNPTLATLRLNRFVSDVTFAKQWRHKFNWTGEYFKCPDPDKDHIGWCGHPGLVRTGFIRDTFQLLRPDQCPERQMKGLYGPTPMRDVIQKWDYGVYSIPSGPPLICDIGRVWRERRGIVKYKDTTWGYKKGIK